jgi:cytoskeletal protein CcmA (bactofilin family)
VSEKTTRLVYSDGTNLVDAGFGGASDMEGRELVLDADGDTTITADTDDQIDIKIAGADDFQFTANTFTAQSGSTIAAQALTATTVTASGIVKTDDTTEATSTTDGSLQTDGGLSVAKDAVIGDDLKLLSDSAVLSFGADSDTTLTHTDGTGLTLNSTNKLLFRDTGLYINSSTDGQLDIVADTEVQIAATTIDINGAIAMDGAITGATNITLSGELDAATLDISGNADIDGTLEADAITINGTAIGSIYGAVAGSSSIVTTGALDSGSITSGFGTIDTGSSAITTTGLISGGSLDIDDVLINGTTLH